MTEEYKKAHSIVEGYFDLSDVNYNHCLAAVNRAFDTAKFMISNLLPSADYLVNRIDALKEEPKPVYEDKFLSFEDVNFLETKLKKCILPFSLEDLETIKLLCSYFTHNRIETLTARLWKDIKEESK